MKHLKQITFWLLLALGTTAVVFTSCKDEEEEPETETTTDTTGGGSTTVSVTGVTLTASTLSLLVDSTYTLSATVSPSNATDKNITWTSSDTTVATIANGKITAKAAGTVTITAKAGDKTVTCTVTITPTPIAVTGISLDKTSLSLLVGETPISDLVATITPTNATDTTVTWRSNDATIATVSAGSVTALSVGTATITAQAGDKTATCTVTVTTLQTSGYVTINGVKWSACNVSTPGAFATTPTTYGFFYQWNSKVGWPSTGAIGGICATDGTTTWNSSWNGGFNTPSTSDTWATTNDPSPTGYRVPTKEEIESLLNTTYVSNTRTRLNRVTGRKFTDIATGNSIFLPTSGNRSFSNGTHWDAGDYGDYWGSTVYSASLAYGLHFSSSTAGRINYNNRAIGLTVRPVAE